MNNCSIGLIHMFKVRLIAFISRQQTRIYDKLLWQFANIFSLLRGKPRLCGPANTQKASAVITLRQCIQLLKVHLFGLATKRMNLRSDSRLAREEWSLVAHAEDAVGTDLHFHGSRLCSVEHLMEQFCTTARLSPT